MTPEKAAYMRAYHVANRDRDNARSRAWGASHREAQHAYAARYRVQNADKVAAAARRKWRSLTAVVYAWFDALGVCDWVGRGTIARARQHRSMKPWWTPLHTLLTMTCDTEWQAMELEGVWGARYQPRHNVEGYRR